MRSRSTTDFTTICTDGATLPPALLSWVRDGELEGLCPEDYHLDTGEKLNDWVETSWHEWFKKLHKSD